MENFMANKKGAESLFDVIKYLVSQVKTRWPMAEPEVASLLPTFFEKAKLLKAENYSTILTKRECIAWSYKLALAI